MLAVAPPKTPQTKAVILEKVASAIAAHPEGNISVDKITQEAAGATNTHILDRHTSSEQERSKFPTLVNAAIVKKFLVERVNNTGQASNSSQSRNLYKKKPINSLYPVTISELERGITQHRAVQIFRDMKKNWTQENCAANKGFRAACLPKSKYSIFIEVRISYL